MRWYEPDEFSEMRRGAGFESVDMQVGYDGRPDPHADLIFEARR